MAMHKMVVGVTHAVNINIMSEFVVMNGGYYIGVDERG